MTRENYVHIQGTQLDSNPLETLTAEFGWKNLQNSSWKTSYSRPIVCLALFKLYRLQCIVGRDLNLAGNWLA